MAEPTHIKDILPDLLPYCRTVIDDHEKIKAILAEAGLDPDKHELEVIEEQITEAVKLTVMKTQKKEG